MGLFKVMGRRSLHMSARVFTLSPRANWRNPANWTAISIDFSNAQTKLFYTVGRERDSGESTKINIYYFIKKYPLFYKETEQLKEWHMYDFFLSGKKYSRSSNRITQELQSTDYFRVLMLFNYLKMEITMKLLNVLGQLGAFFKHFAK